MPSAACVVPASVLSSALCRRWFSGLLCILLLFKHSLCTDPASALPSSPCFCACVHILSANILDARHPGEFKIKQGGYNWCDRQHNCGTFHKNMDGCLFFQTRQRHFDSLTILQYLQKSSPSRLKSREGGFRRTVELISVSFAPFSCWEYRSFSSINSHIINRRQRCGASSSWTGPFQKAAAAVFDRWSIASDHELSLSFPMPLFSSHFSISLHTVLLLWTSLRYGLAMNCLVDACEAPAR